EEGDDGVAELPGVASLLRGPPCAAGLEPPCVRGVGALRLEGRAGLRDALRRRPDAEREPAPAALLADAPARTAGLDAARQGGVAGSEQLPALGQGEHATVLRAHRAGARTGQ